MTRCCRNSEYIESKICPSWWSEISHEPNHLPRFLRWYTSSVCSVCSSFYILAPVVRKPYFIPLFDWVSYEPITCNRGKSSCNEQCGCSPASDNAVLKSRWKTCRLIFTITQLYLTFQLPVNWQVGYMENSTKYHFMFLTNLLNTKSDLMFQTQWSVKWAPRVLPFHRVWNDILMTLFNLFCEFKSALRMEE